MWWSPRRREKGEAEKALRDIVAKKFSKFSKRQNYRLKNRINPKQKRLKEILTEHTRVKLLEKI